MRSTVLLWVLVAASAFVHAQDAVLSWGPGVGNAEETRIERAGEPANTVGIFSGNSWVEWQQPATGAFDIGNTNDLSICVRVCIPAPPAGNEEFTILGKGDRGDNPRLLLKAHANGTASFRLGAGESVTVQGATTITDDEWHHVCAVVDRDSGTYLFVDGKPDGTGAATDAIDYRTESALFLGKSHQAGTDARRFLRGAMHGLAVYGRALAEAEIAQLVADAPTLPEVSLPPPAKTSGKPAAQRPRRVGGISKKTHPNAISDIVDGHAARIVQEFIPRSVATPDDLEAWYVLAAAHAQAGNLAESARCAGEALKRGLPIERFLAGPRDLLEPLFESEEFRELRSDGLPTLLHGPLLGNVTHDSAAFWVRTREPTEVTVTVSDTTHAAGEPVSASASSSADRDFTTVVTVKGLRPSTAYVYRLRLGGTDVGQNWRLRTAPRPGTKSPLKIAFGGGAGYNPQFEYMWSTITKEAPDALLLLGDNVYIDNPTRPAVQRYCYYRRQSRPEYRALTATCPVYAIWDDHDFTTNDQRGGPEVKTPEWKIPVYELFRAQWNNPGYGGGIDQPGCWFSTRIGDVDVIMLDGRYYREAPTGNSPSMLGPVQKAWLFDTLRQATGTFKLLASPVPWAKGTKPGSRDTWDGYDKEREEIFSFIENNHIDGVVLLSADRHRSDIWKIERKNGYDLFEFESSRLTNVHKHGPMKGALFSYNAKCSYGLLSFDLARDDPTVTYTIVDIDGKVIHTFELKHSQLQAGGD